MHVLLLNQTFYPDVAATAQMAKDLADHLIAAGHRVTAVASRSLYGQAGAVLPSRETVGGIDIRRVGASLFGKAGYAARIADFGLFYALGAARVMTTERPDVVVCLTTPPFIALVGLLSRALRGSKAVYWVMDLYPDLPIACGVMREGAMSTRFFEAVNRFVLKRSDADVVLGRCMEARVLDKGVDAARVRVIPVWSSDVGALPIAHEDNPQRAAWGLGGKLAVMYSGNFGIGHEAQTICRAMERLRGEDDLRFVFVGDGKRRAEVETFIRERALTSAAYYDYQPRERLAESLAAGDVHLISLRQSATGIMVPSKVFGILAAGRPSIFIGDPRSEVARVLAEHDAGVLVEEGDDEGLARAIVALRDDPERREAMGRRARQAFLGRYDAKTACDAWTVLLEQIVAFGAPAKSAASLGPAELETPPP